VANPILTDQAFEKATASASGADAALPPPAPGTQAGPISDGPISPYRAYQPMTLDGTIAVTGILFVLLIAAAIWGWNLVDVKDGEVTGFPTWSLIAVLVGFGAVLLAAFKPQRAKFLAPVYAIAEGVFVGAISAAYNAQWDGIVVQAVGATLGVFLVMLFLYRARIVTVTDKFRSVVIGATAGLAVFYLVALVLSLFGMNISFLGQRQQLVRHRVQRPRGRPRLAQPPPRLRPHRARRAWSGTEVHGMVRLPRSARHVGLAVPRAAPPAGPPARQLISPKHPG
jgi:uncharacterized YccA/Bax inhibitor family protein